MKNLVAVIAILLIADSGCEIVSNPLEFYPTCPGFRQSPIDIIQGTTKQLSTLVPFTLTGYNTYSKPGDYYLSNTGYAITLKVLSDSSTPMSFTGGGFGTTERYNLVYVQFHWGSEHTINGKRYPLELQFVHLNTKYDNLANAYNYVDGTATLSVLAEISTTANPALDKILSAFPFAKYAGTTAPVNQSFRMQDLLPGFLDHYYRYEGSVTTVGYWEAITWTVFKDFLKVTQAQIDALRKVYRNRAGAATDEPIQNNFRSTQELHGRSVYYPY